MNIIIDVMGLQSDNINEIYDWFESELGYQPKETCFGFWSRLEFESEEDAMAFKLKWF